MRSPSVIIPRSRSLLTTGAPEIRASAKSLIVSSMVLSGLRIGQSVCMISPTLSSRMSCCSTPYPFVAKVLVPLILLQTGALHTSLLTNVPASRSRRRLWEYGAKDRLRSCSRLANRYLRARALRHARAPRLQPGLHHRESYHVRGARL